MHKIARMDDQDYRPLRSTTGKKKMPIVTRGAVRDYEEAEDNGEEDPMIAEEIEQEKPGKAEKSKTGSSSPVSINSLLRLISFIYKNKSHICKISTQSNCNFQVFPLNGANYSCNVSSNEVFAQLKSYWRTIGVAFRC